MLSIRSLSKTYGKSKKSPDTTRALVNIDLDVAPGMYGLLGPNGAGKSTLMRTIATLQTADSGSITFAGHNVLQDPTWLRSRLGYLPQEFGVYPSVTASELLDHIARLKGLQLKHERDQAVNAMLQRVNLFQVRHKALGTYSGGMKQRFGIAQALIGKPELVIVDEPTAGLDPEERARFHNLLADIGEDIVVLLSTHIVDDVRDLCQRFSVIAKGKVRLSGTPAEAMAALAGRVFVRRLKKSDAAALEASGNVVPPNAQLLSRQLRAGEVEWRVLSHNGVDLSEQGYSRTEVHFEDSYFAAVHQADTATLEANAA